LGPLLLADAAAAVGAASLVAPAIAVIDKAIFCHASGRAPLPRGLTHGLSLVTRRPVHFLGQPSFLLVWLVYVTTYACANSASTLALTTADSDAMPKFIATSVANVSASLAKDGYFTRAFGPPPSTSRPVGWNSYGLYMIRDGLTIWASFTVPPLVGAALATRKLLPVDYCQPVAQLLTPVTVQLVSTPIHLWGMDLYNRPSASIPQRLAFVQAQYGAATLARMSRIFPAFGIGGVANTAFRARG
ncbi:hypothetical protein CAUPRSCDRAFT_3417, partial [Caulochytrium protostelioides]